MPSKKSHRSFAGQEDLLSRMLLAGTTRTYKFNAAPMQSGEAIARQIRRAKLLRDQQEIPPSSTSPGTLNRSHIQSAKRCLPCHEISSCGPARSPTVYVSSPPYEQCLQYVRISSAYTFPRNAVAGGRPKAATAILAWSSSALSISSESLWLLPVSAYDDGAAGYGGGAAGVFRPIPAVSIVLTTSTRSTGNVKRRRSCKIGNEDSRPRRGGGTGGTGREERRRTRD
jgi:hypothetical protein